MTLTNLKVKILQFHNFYKKCFNLYIFIENWPIDLEEYVLPEKFNDGNIELNIFQYLVFRFT